MNGTGSLICQQFQLPRGISRTWKYKLGSQSEPPISLTGGVLSRPARTLLRLAVKAVWPPDPSTPKAQVCGPRLNPKALWAGRDANLGRGDA